jgi:hypothetical protein
MASLTWKPLIDARPIAWQFHSFGQDYLRRLASGDAVVEHHFGSYYGDLLFSGVMLSWFLHAFSPLS